MASAPAMIAPAAGENVPGSITTDVPSFFATTQACSCLISSTAPTPCQLGAPERLDHDSTLRAVMYSLSPQVPPQPTDPHWLVNPLSQSEAQVLSYLPTSLSAPEIARELSVSVTIAAGSDTTIVTLPPGVSSGSTVPPIASARPRATMRPSPTPTPVRPAG